MSAIAETLAFWHNALAFGLAPVPAIAPVKALLVVAHPDDESECAAAVYRITHELDGLVDQVVVTNGEGGHSYAAPAASYYRLPLHKKEGRADLIRIRREEQLRASRTLGIRHTYFLDQPDTGVTTDVEEPVRSWDVELLKSRVSRLIERENYDVVIVLLPTAETHGHHKAVAVLTLEAIERLPAGQRPTVLGAQTEESSAFAGLDGYPLTRAADTHPVWSFDRRTPLKCHPALDHSIIVNWAVSEHKSQGFFQMESTRRRHEHFWLFETGGDARERWLRVSERIGG